MESSEKNWYRKYMKYKAKYIELKKKRQSGGVTFKSGKYLFILNKENMDAKMRTSYGKDKKAPSIFEMNQDFSDMGYRIAYGSNKAELIIDNKKRAEKALEVAKEIAKTSGKVIASTASVVAEKTGQVLSATEKAVKEGINKGVEIIKKKGGAISPPEVIILSEIVTEVNVEKIVREIAEKIKGSELEGKMNTGLTIDVAMIGANKFIDMKVVS